MARNRITIDAPVERVFSVLSDPYAYPHWVVGTHDVVEADTGWPKPGSSLRYETGRMPFRFRGTTEVEVCDPPHRMLLRARLPLGALRIDIELRQQETGTLLEMSETVPGSPFRPSIDAALHFRNWQALSRLKRLVEESHLALDAESLHPAGHWLDEPPFARVIEQAERCYVAVGAKGGPHVTPTAFSTAFGRIWLITPRGSLKARTLTSKPRIGVTVRHQDLSVVVWGSATVLDPRQLWIPRDVIERLLAGPAIAGYLSRNRRRIRGLSSVPSSMMQLNPLDRVLVAIAPERIALVDGAHAVEQRGSAPLSERNASPRGDVPRRSGVPLRISGSPTSIAELAEESRIPAILGWESAAGPVALPARWHGDRSLVSVPAVLLEEKAGRAALCLDDETVGELDDQIGMLVRGEGRVLGVEGGYAAVSIDTDRATVWEGAATETVTTPE